MVTEEQDALDRELNNLATNGHAVAVDMLRPVVAGIPHNWRRHSSVVPLVSDTGKTHPGAIEFDLHNGQTTPGDDGLRCLRGDVSKFGQIVFTDVKLS